MNKAIVVTGATGFVGKKLCLELILRGYDLRVISRNPERARETLALPARYFGKSSPEVFEGAHAVIHLAGEPIAERRWSQAVKREIRRSRKEGTQEIVRDLAHCKNPPKILVGTSAIGIYGERGMEILSEESARGSGFLSDVCAEWEEAYQEFPYRRVILRVGVVLGHGGALEKMLPAFRLGGGGKLASGNQWMSWVHIDDLVGMYMHGLENENLSGVYNAVAPGTVTNSEFTRGLAKVLHRPAIFPVPGLALRLIFGEMSKVLLGSQRVSADKILAAGFSFRFPRLDLAFQDLLKPLGITGAYTFEAMKWVPQDRSEVFPFFSEARNLEKITPPWLNFRIQKLSTDAIEEGTLIDYRLKIKGVPVGWRTRISSWNPPEVFVDEQLRGPYRVWHHTHRFVPLRNGTLMIDRVVYQMPFGILGDIARLLMVKKDVQTIFGYRSQVIGRMFPPTVQNSY